MKVLLEGESFIEDEKVVKTLEVSFQKMISSNDKFKLKIGDNKTCIVNAEELYKAVNTLYEGV